MHQFIRLMYCSWAKTWSLQIQVLRMYISTFKEFICNEFVMNLSDRFLFWDNKQPQRRMLTVTVLLL